MPWVEDLGRFISHITDFAEKSRCPTSRILHEWDG